MVGVSSDCVSARNHLGSVVKIAKINHKKIVIKHGVLNKRSLNSIIEFETVLGV